METTPQVARERMDRIASADLTVGVLQSGASSSIVLQALEKLSPVPRTVIIQGNGLGSTDGAGAADAATPSEDQTVFVVPWALLEAVTAIPPVDNSAKAYPSVLPAGEKLGARAVCILAPGSSDRHFCNGSRG